jgi:hypothetical protein
MYCKPSTAPRCKRLRPNRAADAAAHRNGAEIREQRRLMRALDEERRRVLELVK